MKKDNSSSLTPLCFLLKTHVDVNLKTLLLTKNTNILQILFTKHKKKQKKEFTFAKKQKEPREQLLTLKAQQIRHNHKNEQAQRKYSFHKYTVSPPQDSCSHFVSIYTM